MKYCSIVAALLWSFFAGAQTTPADARIITNMDEGWQFTKDAYHVADVTSNASIKWDAVNLPHTWNTKDVMDDKPGYYRAACWYRKTFSVPDAYKFKQVFFYFEGANQETEVFINGVSAGKHIGGYTGFCIPVNKFLKFDNSGNKNEIVVKVDNSRNENIPPLSADFTFYGGIYRNVFLIAANDVHFSLTDNASKGVYISTPQVSAASATVNIRGSFTNASSADRRINIVTRIVDKTGKTIAQVNTSVTGKANDDNSFIQEMPSVKNPCLWSPEDPYLYTVTTKIVDAASGKLLDQVSNPLGFRWFKFYADKGFFLNGKHYKLIGTSRHQDFKGMGNALPHELAKNDVALIKKMGGNFLRVAHYPQDQTVLQTCDELGILASVEIPVVNEITESETFYSNCKNMQVEMIRQNYNHPSVIMWCYMNEILLKMHFNDDKARQKIYVSNVTQLAKSLDSITRKEDPYRYTMIANHGDFNKYNNAGLTTISMVLGWNLYSGWYGGKQEDFPAFLRKHHDSLPNQPVMITEYGADADPRIRSFNAARFDKSVEYTTQFHQYYLSEILNHNYVAGAVVWNLADFNSETREETMPHINNKGLLTWDRIPKDPYYLYQAMLLKTPFIKITSSGWTQRGGVADSLQNFCSQPVQVASNLDSAEIKMNGKSFGKKKIETALCEWDLPFKDGINKIEVSGKKNGKVYTDSLNVNFALQPYNLKSMQTPFKQINILVGAKRYFIDDSIHRLWLPDQPYRKGSWGYIGGNPYKIDNGSRIPYGTDKGIRNTDNDPVYQTQQMGIEKYVLDVPSGNYELTLYFAELQGGAVKELAYNLADTSRVEDNVKRIFNVYVNNVLVLEHFNMTKQFGLAKAIAKKVEVNVPDSNGVQITFKALSGEAVLNALELKKID
ncbi:glycoside hydrolase family 2 TIM barrel-domain containing protein [Chitinophagaceae bacterium LWZ2-11]